MAKSIGEIVRARRERLGITQTDLAKIVGVAPNQISRVESGGRPNLYFETVARIAFALDLSLDDLAAQCGFRPAIAGKSPSRTAPAVTSQNLEALRHKAEALERGLAAEIDRQAAQVRAPRKRG